MDVEKMFRYQMARAELAARWLDLLDLKPGAQMVDVGCGPGYISLLAAERVGPAGMVWAVDRSAEALAFLAGQQRERGLAQVRAVHADAEAMTLPGAHLDGGALVAFVLHHVADPAAVLQQVAALLPQGAPLVVPEFDPTGPGEMGPPLAKRLEQERLRQACVASGFTDLTVEQQSPEHYLIAGRRG